MKRRRSIILPPTTTVQGAVSTSIVQLFEDQILGMIIDSSHNVQISTCTTAGTAAGLATVPTSSALAALGFLMQIQNFLNSDSGGSVTPFLSDDSTLVWTSITPNTVSVNVNMPPLAIVGVGFEDTFGLGQNVYFLLSTDGGNSGVEVVGVVNSDTAISIAAGPGYQLNLAATWTVYYAAPMLDLWVTTALTVTAS